MSMFRIEFIGGPFDGYSLPLSVSPDDLKPQIAMPVSNDLFRIMEGQLPTNAQVTSVAFYRLDGSTGAFCYHFVGARRPTKLHIGG
jgi:hypothetical protein